MESRLAEQNSHIDAPIRTDYRPTFDHRVSSPAIEAPVATADAAVLASAYAKSAAAIAAGIAVSEAAAAGASIAAAASPAPVPTAASPATVDSSAANTPTFDYDAPAVVPLDPAAYPPRRRYRNAGGDGPNRYGVFLPFDIDPKVFTNLPYLFSVSRY